MKKAVKTGTIPNWKRKSHNKKRFSSDYEVTEESKSERNQYDDKLYRSRLKFFRNYYGKVQFKEDDKVVEVKKGLGLEEDLGYFTEIASKILDGFPNEVVVDLRECPRIWPSGVMLLCSYYHWMRLKAESVPGAKVTARSKKETSISEYLSFCGLRKYFTDLEEDEVFRFTKKEIVKLKRETSKEMYDIRINQIYDLVENYSGLSAQKLKRFKDIILNELFINISEHGVNYRDMGYEETNLGWYVIGQVHKKSGFISICIGDNGIGIKNSLVTGPLSSLISKLVSREARLNGLEGEYMEMAIKQKVSGAIDARRPEWKWRKMKKEFQQGSHRGMGFSRIKKNCDKIGIEMNILSGKGYLNIDENGDLNNKSYEENIFMGTLFNIKIPINAQELV